MARLPHLLLAALLPICGSMAVAIAALGTMNGTGLGHVSGVWTAMALDLRNGLFYRPIYDPNIGFGGTRFFPLMFVTQAALASLGGTLVGAGHAASAGAGFLLIGGLIGLLRKLGGGWWVSATVSVWLLCTATVQVGLQSIRGDILPLACSLIGLAVFLTALPRWPREMLSALLFTMAFATKMTAIHGPATLCLWLVANGRSREAARVSLATAVGYVMFLVVLVVATSGRIFRIFEVSAFGGGGLSDVVYAPIKLTLSLISDDPVSLLAFAAAMACVLTLRRDLSRTLPAAFLFVSLGITTVQYTSPGIEFNHLVDLTTASLLVLGTTQLTGMTRTNRAVWWAVGYVALAACWNINNVRREWTAHTAGYTRYPDELVRRIADSDGPVVSENPLLPVLAGRSPFVLDPFMLRLILQRSPEMERELLHRVQRREFSLIVLQRTPSDAPIRYSSVHFGSSFVEAVALNYERDPTVASFAVFLPRRNVH